MNESEKKPEMTKKKDKTSGMDNARAYERQQAAKDVPQESAAELVEFEIWWAARVGQLKQPVHVKDIMKADAKGRGLTGLQPMDKWDWAARKYGLNF